jgi:hypothetical protein
MLPSKLRPLSSGGRLIQILGKPKLAELRLSGFENGERRPQEQRLGYMGRSAAPFGGIASLFEL